MSLYYLDPEREPRECFKCRGDGEGDSFQKGRVLTDGFKTVCTICNGTGRLGVEGAEPDVETYRSNGGWAVMFQKESGGHLAVGHFPTEAAALAAARRASRREVKR